jgi:alpha-L-rhamnosidase
MRNRKSLLSIPSACNKLDKPPPARLNIPGGWFKRKGSQKVKGKIMERMIKTALLVSVLLLAGCGEKGRKTSADLSSQLSAADLRCEYHVNPMGIDVLQPRLTWILQSDRGSQMQTAYQVQVASSRDLLDQDQPDLWDSGKVTSDETIAVVYDGKPLTSEANCFWKVRVWDRKDRASGWSTPAFWTMGLLKPEDWTAQWIGLDMELQPQPMLNIIRQARWIWSDAGANQSAPLGQRYFRKTFDLPADWVIRSAVCYVTADDFVQVFLNGHLTRSFRNRKVLYEVTLTDYLSPGKNVLAIRAANEGRTPTPAGLLMAVRIDAVDGRFLEFVTDTRWRCSSEETAGWQTADLDDSALAAAFEVGSFGSAPWQETAPLPLILPPARYLRKEFSVPQQKIKQARLYATALGIYQLFLNGRRVTENDYLSPGWTDYRKRVYYRTYEVTDLLRDSGNALGAILADGWYSGYVGGGLRRARYGSQPRFLAQLQIEYEDGSRQVITTGPDWKASPGPILYADLLQGEGYDARKEIPGWDQAGFDDSRWQAVTVGGQEVNPRVQAAVSEPVIAFTEVRPVAVTEPVAGKYVFDMGQNFAGLLRIKVQGKPGQRIDLRHAERLNTDGTIYTINLRTAAAADVYFCKGARKAETWQPYLTFHGFQYVELTGLDYKPDLDTVTGLALSSDTPAAASFECSDPMVNKLYSNIVWTQRMNFIDIPTDCPQRDERLGWTGDAQVYIAAACYNNDVQAFFTKWLTDLTDAQRNDGQFPRYAPLWKEESGDGGPAWADAGIICPWTIYQMYGDQRILQTHYESMKRFLAFNKNRCTADLLPPEKFHCFGDWLNINDDTPHDVIYMAYLGHCTNLMVQIADAIGKPEDAADYRDLFAKIRTSFQKAYIQPDGRIKGDTQAVYVLAIAYGLLEPDQQEQAADHLVRRILECKGHLSTGFVGTKDLMLALAKIGRNDLAYQLLGNETFPSWGFTIKNGATSIWERWNGWTPEQGFADPGMNSFAHYSFGAVGQWMIENIGGIQTDGPAFKEIIIRPQPGGKLTWAKTTYRSIRGPITSDWKIKRGRLTMDVTIPPNTTAVVYVPAQKPEDVWISQAGPQDVDGFNLLRVEENAVVYQVRSGQYRFEAKPYTGSKK